MGTFCWATAACNTSAARDLGVYDALASRAGGDMNTGTFAD